MARRGICIQEYEWKVHFWLLNVGKQGKDVSLLAGIVMVPDMVSHFLSSFLILR